jgi:hypothetical protein
MSQFQARQGDIFFKKVDKIPSKGLKKKSDGIFAHGELTGHSHKLTTDISDSESYVDEKGDIYIRSHKEMKVGHDEHSTIVLPANEWICVTRQREWNALSVEKERRVAD